MRSLPSFPQHYALQGARVLLEEGLKEDVSVVMGGTHLIDVVEASGRPADVPVVRLPTGSILAPGFIDAQVNGGGGLLFNDTPDTACMAKIAQAHRRGGTTTLLPTLITDAPDKMRAAAQALRQWAGLGKTTIPGVHFEGPFLNALRSGVHDPRFIRPLQDADVAFLSTLASDLPDYRVLLTLAPEHVVEGAWGDPLRYLATMGVVLAAGHTAASTEQIEDALARGLSGFTHLFNAMPPILNREPGPIPAALLNADSWCGVIVDGIHVHPSLLRLALLAKPQGKVFLVTDAMPPTGTEMAEFWLEGRRILRRNGRLETQEGVLAGADLDMAQAVRNAVALLGISQAEALRMATLYPARFLRLDQNRGRIAPGLRADLVLLTSNLHVLGTWVEGRWESADSTINFLNDHEFVL